MARNVFYSFHYVPDGWRVAQVRNMGVLEGNRPASDNDWERVKRGVKRPLRVGLIRNCSAGPALWC